MGKEFFAGIFFVAATIIAVYFFRTLLRKDDLGKSMARVLLAGLIAEFSYVAYLLTNDYFLMSLSNSIMFASIDWILFFLFQFCYLFTEIQNKRVKLYKFFSIILVLDTIQLLVNPFHEHSLHYEVVEKMGSKFLVYVPRIMFQFHLALCYIMVAGILTILLYKCVHVAKLYRVRYAVFGVAFLVVIVINVIHIVTGEAIDFSVLSYAGLCCFLYFYVFDYKGLAASNATKAYFIEEMNNPMIFFDYEDKLLMCNRRAREFFSLSPESTKAEFIEANPYLELDGREEQYFETTLPYKDNMYYFQIQYKFLKDHINRAIGTVFVFEDITEKKQALIQTEYNATHDVLTGIYNRNYLVTLKRKAIEENIYPIHCGAYRVKNMRYLNKQFGTECGDRALRRMAWLLQQFSRVSDVVIRVDGGEMILLLPNTTEAKANDIFRKIEKRIEIFEVEGIPVGAYCSYFCLEKIEDFDNIYEEAHRALAIQKENESSECRVVM